MTWADAKSNCASKGYKLAKPKTQNGQKALETTLSESGFYEGYDKVWIGLAKSDKVEWYRGIGL